MEEAQLLRHGVPFMVSVEKDSAFDCAYEFECTMTQINGAPLSHLKRPTTERCQSTVSFSYFTGSPQHISIV